MGGGEGVQRDEERKGKTKREFLKTHLMDTVFRGHILAPCFIFGTFGHGVWFSFSALSAVNRQSSVCSLLPMWKSHRLIGIRAG